MDQITYYFKNLPVRIIDGLIGLLPTILFAAIILFAGNVISKIALKLMNTALDKGKIDKTVGSFLNSLVKIILKLFILVIVLSVLGIPMTSIITVIGTAGLAIGLALQNSLSNLAGGFIILFTKPVEVGDFVESNGTTGTVTAINILYTQIVTPDNQEAYIPNGLVANNKITNISRLGKRRLDLEFAVDYNADFEKAKSIISKIIEKSEYSLKDCDNVVKLGGHGTNGLIIHIRAWVHPDNYWNLYYEIYEQAKVEFEANSIIIPHNQLDVHVINNA